MIPSQPAPAESLQDISQAFENLEIDPNNPQDILVHRALYQALRAATEGNFGVGAIIYDRNTDPPEVVWEGRNQVMEPEFQPWHHAEFDVVQNLLGSRRGKLRRNELRRQGREHQFFERYGLVSTLEPCPMCYAHLIVSGIPEVYYAAADEQGGMVQRHQQLPPVFQQIAGKRVFAPSTCSQPLKDLALRIFLSNVRDLDARLSS